MGHSNHQSQPVPEFMAALGLLAPYTEEDVKQAYWSGVKKLHPDHGGTAQEFLAFQEAYEQAKEYVRFHGDKRRWIANYVDQYVAHESLVEKLHKLGAEAQTRTIEWMQRSVGDFAELTRSIVAISLENSPRGDALVEALARDHESLQQLTELRLSGCKVTDAAVLHLNVLHNLQHLDLSRTPVTSRAMSVVDTLPMLVTLQLDGTSVGWWTRRKVKSQLLRHANHPKFTVGRTFGFRDLQSDF